MVSYSYMRRAFTNRTNGSAMRAIRSHLFALTLVGGTTAFTFAVENGRAQAPSRSSREHLVSADSTGLNKSGDGGPYVFLQSDSSAVVMYMRDSAVDRQTCRYLDTLRFSGVGSASGTDYVVSGAPPAVGAQVFDGVSKIIAVSDVHGDYESLIEVLQNGGVIDKNLRWVWGTGHLVVLGDIFDRGDKVNDCLWLIYRLEQESQRVGGLVHFILGNHELMVLRGDYRYVHRKYLSGIVTAAGLEYRDLYGPNTVLGQWLRSKHAALKINGVLFVHGGISRLSVERGLSLTQINEGIRASIDEASSALAVDTLRQLLLGRQGPLWYRGYLNAMEGAYPLASCEDIDLVLRHYEATTIVIGHTEVEQVSGSHDTRIIAVDVPVEELGGLQALLCKDGRFYRIEGGGDIQPIE